MGASDWRIIYRGYSGEELTAEVVSLRAGLAGGFQSLGSGSVNHSRDLTELRDRLRAATDVQAERGGRSPGRNAVVDFSANRNHAHPLFSR